MVKESSRRVAHRANERRFVHLLCEFRHGFGKPDAGNVSLNRSELSPVIGGRVGVGADSDGGGGEAQVESALVVEQLQSDGLVVAGELAGDAPRAHGVAADDAVPRLRHVEMEELREEPAPYYVGIA